MDVTINLFWIFLIVVCFIIARIIKDNLDNKKDIHFKDKDVETVTAAFKQIGEVSKNATPDQVILNLQNVENNKEIHSNNKKIDKLENVVEFLQNENGKLRADLSVLRTRFDALTKAIGKD